MNVTVNNLTPGNSYSLQGTNPKESLNVVSDGHFENAITDAFAPGSDALDGIDNSKLKQLVRQASDYEYDQAPDYDFWGDPDEYSQYVDGGKLDEFAKETLGKNWSRSEHSSFQGCLEEATFRSQEHNGAYQELTLHEDSLELKSFTKSPSGATIAQNIEASFDPVEMEKPFFNISEGANISY